MWKRVVALLLVVLVFGVPLWAAQPASGNEVVYVVPLTGVVEAGLESYLERSFREAENAGASAIILELNTPGGIINSATNIRTLIANSTVPIYAYVRHNAISAGAYLALSCRALYMAPGSTIGAAEPRTMTGGEVDEKITSYWEAEMRTAAEQQGKDPEVAAAMVRKEIAIEGLVTDTRLLTLTTQDAEKIGYTDGVFNTRAELLQHLNLSGANVVNVPQTPAEELARFITLPHVATMIITIALAALVIEVMTAGFGVAGMISILAFALFFGGHIVAGLAGREVVFLFLLGIVLLLVEAFIPNFGVLGVSGLAAVVMSIVLSSPTTGAGLRMLFIAFFLASLIVAVAFHFLKRTGLWSQIILQFAETKEQGYVGPTNAAHLLGKIGITVTPLRPAGVADIDGKRVDVISEGGFIDQATAVTVVATEGTRVVVRPQ